MDKDLLPEIESAGQNYDSYNNDVDVDFSEFDLNDNDNSEDDEGFTPISKLIANYGVTLQTVSIYIKNHPDLFEGHLKKTARRTSVDKIGVQLLDDFYITGKSKRVVSLKEYKDLNERYNDTLKKAVNKLSGKSEELSKIMDNGNNFDLTIIVLVPHATLENDDIKNSIINCIRNKDFHKNYMFSIDGIKDEEMYELPEIIERAEILFESQTYASITCEVLNIIDEKLAGKKQVTDEDRNELLKFIDILLIKEKIFYIKSLLR